jgi:hypothetical protein
MLGVARRWAPLASPPRRAARTAQEREPLGPQLFFLAVVERR